jgi:hypothetical protein
VPPVVPSVVPLIAVGGEAGVRVFAADGAPRFTRTPFGSGFAGGVRVATGDVTGDGVTDVIAAAGPGGGPHVLVYDGATGNEVASTFAFEPSFTGGLSVAAGDVNADGYADLVVGAGAGGGPRIKVLSGRDLSVLADFFAFEADFRGGVTVAAGDVDGDGRADVVAAPAAGGGPRVRAFGGPGIALGSPGTPVIDFLAGPAGDRGGARVVVKPAHADQPATLLAASGDRGRLTAYRLPIAPTGSPAELFDLDVFADDPAGVYVG